MDRNVQLARKQAPIIHNGPQSPWDLVSFTAIGLPCVGLALLGVALDAKGTLYVADSDNDCVRVIGT
jgi:hypothetical protein